MAETAIFTHKDCLLHLTGPGHPEKPGRLKAVLERLEKSDLPLSRQTGKPADPALIELNHTKAHIEQTRAGCSQGLAFLDAGDTAVCADSFDAALLAAGCTIDAVDAVLSEQVKNAFCAVRPPGHHAESDRAMGFCLFNNAAIGARYAKKHGLQRVMIVDFDVHHGNGTQNSFYSDDSVFYFSVHQFPHYPGTGAAAETGAGPGRGYTLNVPMDQGSGDKAYISALETQLVPVADRFKPELLILSAGFDAYAGDPLSGTGLTEAGYQSISRIFTGIARAHCNNRLVSILEGGYNIAALPGLVEIHIKALVSA